MSVELQDYYIVPGFFVERKAVTERVYWTHGYFKQFGLYTASSEAEALSAYYKSQGRQTIPAYKPTLIYRILSPLVGE